MSDIIVITGASSSFGARRLVALPTGERPFRVHIDPANDGSEEVSEVADRVRREFLTRVDLADLLTTRT